MKCFFIGAWISQGLYAGAQPAATTEEAREAYRCDWDRVDGRSLTKKVFRQKYWLKRPVILTHMLSEWPATQRWTETKFLEDFGDEPMPRNCVKPLDVGFGSLDYEGMRLRDVFKLVENATSENDDPHLKYAWFVNPSCSLSRKIKARGDIVLPPLLWPMQKSGPHLSVGRGGQGITMHTHEHFYLALFTGAKRWHIAEKKPSFVKWPCDEASPEYRKEVMECVQQAGEVAYFPHDTWHGTCNLKGNDPTNVDGRSFNVGITYIDSFEDFKPLVQASFMGNLSMAKAKESRRGLGPALVKTSFHAAVNSGHLPLVEYLFTLRANPSSALDTQGQRPIHIAALEGSLDVAKFLTAHGAEVNSAMQDRSSPMHHAAQLGHAEMVEYLAVMQADVNAADRDGMIPMYHAVKFGLVSVAERLVARRADPQLPLKLAGQQGTGIPLVEVAKAQLRYEMVEFLENHSNHKVEL